MPSVNPDILKWARETAGLTPDQAVKKLGINVVRGIGPLDRLAALENGDICPTRPMLVKMAKQYRRPLLAFYLSVPPRTGDRGQDFRTLPAAVEMSDQALVDAVVRNIRARQSLIRAILEEEDEAALLPFVGSADLSDDPSDLARRITETLRFELHTYRRRRSTKDAVAYLRGQAEAIGVFVLFVDNLGSHHTEIPVDLFRGFALASDVAPFVAVNANDSKGAQAFTIVHELVHIWLGATGVSGIDGEMRIEKFCNDVAGELLLPAHELTALSVSEAMPISEAAQVIIDIAHARNVSATMAAYKLHREGAFPFSFYKGIAGALRQNFLNQKKREREAARAAGGAAAYSIIRRHRAGPALVSLVDRMLAAGALTTAKAGKVLGVSAKNVEGVLRAGEPRASA